MKNLSMSLIAMPAFMKRLFVCIVVAAVVLFAVNCADIYGTADESDSATGYSQDVNADIITVRVPGNLNFRIDPYNTAGRGQIYSEMFSFMNDDETDLLLTFADVRIVLPNDDDYLLVDYPIGLEFENEKKAIYLALDFEEEFSSHVTVTAGYTPDVSLVLPAKGGAVSFSVVGSVNDDFNNRWYDGEVKISLTYRFERINSYSVIEQGEPEQALDELTDSGTYMENTGTSESAIVTRAMIKR
jgi:hypothetical protein